jgi:hypothetical protein
MTKYRGRAHRFLRLTMRLDQAGSAAFIALALALAPVLALLSPFGNLLWLVGPLVAFCAVSLAALGFLNAWGLSRVAVRGEELPDDVWESVHVAPVSSRGRPPASTARHRPGSPAGRG